MTKKWIKEKMNNRGFTLTELVLYMGLLIILITILSQVFASILDVQLESKSTSSVELDGIFILTKLAHDMRLMQTNLPTNDSITIPSAPGVTSPTLNFTVNSINYTYDLNNGNLRLNNENLNSTNTTVTSIQFTRIGTGLNTDTIQIDFTLTSKINRNNGPETRSYTTTISSK